MRRLAVVWLGIFALCGVEDELYADSCNAQKTTSTFSTSSDLSRPPVGLSQGPIAGSRVDLEPDFDIYDVAGREVSSNCNDCMGGPLDVGQTVRPKLSIEVSNSNASGYKRDSDSNTIEGPIWWKIEGKTNWTLLASGEYTISKLDKGRKVDKTHSFVIPNYPGDTIAWKACVDGDDEIYEEGESSSKQKITGPDQSGTSNNCSRTERNYIRVPNYAPTSHIDSSNCDVVTGWAKDQNTTAPLWVQVYSANPDGTNQVRLDDFVASANRPDVGGNFGIDWPVPLTLKDGVVRTVTFSAVNVPEGANSTIGSVTLTCAAPAPENNTPTGTIESGDCTSVIGWAKDTDTAASLSVRVFASNSDGSNQVQLPDFVADVPRGDIGGTYGISWTVPDSVKDGQPHKLTFSAVNVPEGPNLTLGSVTVTCPLPTTVPASSIGSAIWTLFHAVPRNQ